MGGRGTYAGSENTQIKMITHLRRQEIEQIRDTGQVIRAKSKETNIDSTIAGVGGGASGQAMKKRCFCCLQYTLPAYSEYETCPVCGWIDDPQQNKDTTLTQGRNSISLKEARQKWKGQKN